MAINLHIAAEPAPESHRYQGLGWTSSAQVPGQTRTERMHRFFESYGLTYVTRLQPMEGGETRTMHALAARYHEWVTDYRAGLPCPDEEFEEELQELTRNSERFASLIGTTNPNTEVEWINDDLQFGLVARQIIPRGAWIGEYTGEFGPAPHTDSDYYWEDRTPLIFRYRPYLDPIRIDAKHCGNELRFLNHQDELDIVTYTKDRQAIGPNVVYSNIFTLDSLHLVFLASRDIYAGDELRISYGRQYWLSRKR